MLVDKKISVDITKDGEASAFSMLGVFRKQALKEGWTEEEVVRVTDEAMKGDYIHVRDVLREHCDEQSSDGDF